MTYNDKQDRQDHQDHQDHNDNIDQSTHDLNRFDKHIGERVGSLTIICRSKRSPNGYLYYYWCLCDCGNLKCYRYDQARKKARCGMCKDFKASQVASYLTAYLDPNIQRGYQALQGHRPVNRPLGLQELKKED